eukprot:2212316-Rhodomonas_salina.1
MPRAPVGRQHRGGGDGRRWEEEEMGGGDRREEEIGGGGDGRRGDLLVEALGALDVVNGGVAGGGVEELHQVLQARDPRVQLRAHAGKSASAISDPRAGAANEPTRDRNSDLRAKGRASVVCMHASGESERPFRRRDARSNRITTSGSVTWRYAHREATSRHGISFAPTTAYARDASQSIRGIPLCSG